MSWKQVTVEDVETYAYEPWLIDCPNSDCNSTITLTGSGGPSKLSCPSCESSIQVAIRIEQ
jgi:hypothetical protein